MGIFQRISSEVSYLRGALRALGRASTVLKNPDKTLRETIEALAVRFDAKPAITSQDASYSYAQWNARTNQYARWTLVQGLAKGDTIALLMPNKAEYVCIWPGFAKAGCVTALLNTNLTGAGLAHCITIAKSRCIVVDASLLPIFETARALLPADIKVFVYGAGAAGADQDLIKAVKDLPAHNLSGQERCPINIADRALYVYTSGTTGLPKAANLNHSRVQRIMQAFSGAADAKPTDRMYIALPLYHSTGGVLALGVVLTVGGSCHIKEKFSATQFWSDIVAQQCTMFVYVGELCRYLMHAPPTKYDAAHKIRLCVGNGLRPDIFAAFQARFAIGHVLEFYGATEGNISLFNFDSKAGSVGRIPKWAESKYLVKIIAFDVEKEQPIRDANGFCIECKPGEIGEIIAQILNDPNRPTNVFDGYADKAATEKKILRDAFVQGDAWFRSGDLMHKDELGYFYFDDRIGDTFRWKGENVSTGEVAACIASFPGVADTNVYGVAVPGMEGRVGMVAIQPEHHGSLDLAALRPYLASHLPEYARPLFLRLQSVIEVTGTFKQRKVELVKEGFDPGKVSDPLYFSDAATKSFVPLDGALFERLQRGQVRL